VFAIGLAVLVGVLLAALAILQCGLATAAGADRTLAPTGSRIIDALGDPMVTTIGGISLAVAVVGYAGLGAFVGRRGGSSGFAALLAGVSFAAASVISVIVEQILYPTAYYYYTAVGNMAYYIVNLAYVIAVLFAAVAAGLAAVARRLTSAGRAAPVSGGPP
jgi:hypothetical protein